MIKQFKTIKEFMHFVMNADEPLFVVKNKAYNEDKELIAEFKKEEKQ